MKEGKPPTEIAAWMEMVKRLRHAPDWPPEDPPVDMVQTHISVVLLGSRHALKLKKPVNFGFLDYTTLEKRRRACEAEVSLNRRLCPDVYLGVQPIVEFASSTALHSMTAFAVAMSRARWRFSPWTWTRGADPTSVTTLLSATRAGRRPSTLRPAPLLPLLSRLCSRQGAQLPPG
jgi:hypothetical protein